VKRSGGAGGEATLAAQQAEVTLPQVEPKEVEKPKAVVQPPAPETRAPQRAIASDSFSRPLESL